jgi:trehalose 6-phosphate phosphatase
MQYLFDSWESVTNKIQAARHVLLMFDFDGTLTPIVDTPEIADLHVQTRVLLRGLSRYKKFTVAVISGRALNDLQSKIAVPGIIYAGNHGLEIEGPELSFIHPITEEIKPALRIMGIVLKKALGAIQGAMVEDKGITLSIHYRLVDDGKAQQVKDIVENTVGVAEMLGKVRTRSGKMVYEIMPAVSWDKGKAVKYIMKRYGRGGRQSGLLPIYFGDDLTDEDAFKVIESYGGTAIYVGDENKQSAAGYYLKSNWEVDDFMRLLLRLN